MCRILLAIHPEYVDKIISGEKKFEFRKVVAKRQPDKLLIYSTYPIGKIVAEAEIEDILIDIPEKIWCKTKKYAGVSKKFYIQYYSNKEKAVAYKLKNVIEYDEPKELNDLGIKTAPQSFIYI